MKRILRVSIIISLFLAPVGYLKAATNSEAENETQQQTIWQYYNQEPEISSIGVNPGIPEAPIDSNLYVLFFAALCYGVYQRKRLSRLAIRG